jgi:hypothetical protein
MAKMISDRRSTFGTNCIRCNDELIAPEKSEYRLDTHIRHLWYCSNCDTSFESLESIPVEVMTTDDIFPSTVVARMRGVVVPTTAPDQ